jgi:hypothetical protein
VTLVELMVALFIVMIMMSFLIPVVIRSMRLRRRTEEVAEIHATARGALGLLRRDLTGAFRTAVAMYDFSGAHSLGGEFHWEAPVDGDPADGFRRLTFVSGVDGSRVPGDTLGPYEYCTVSWAARGALFRKVSTLRVSVDTSEPSVGDPGPIEGVGAGGLVYKDDGATFTDVGTFRGAPYLMTDQANAAGASPSSTVDFWGVPLRGRFTFVKDDTSVQGESTRFQTDLKPGDFIMGGKDGVWTEVSSIADDSNLTLAAGYGGATYTGVGLLKATIPLTVTLCFDEDLELPGWAEGFERLEGAKIETTAGYFDLYVKSCPDGRVYLGPNGGESGDNMYFVIIEPAWWSLGAEAAELVFYPPAAYIDYLGANAGDMNGTWDDADDGTADGIWTGPVPAYVDVVLKMVDEAADEADAPRRFGQRIAIPAGVGP